MDEPEASEVRTIIEPSKPRLAAEILAGRIPRPPDTGSRYVRCSRFGAAPLCGAGGDGALTAKGTSPSRRRLLFYPPFGRLQCRVSTLRSK